MLDSETRRQVVTYYERQRLTHSSAAKSITECLNIKQLCLLCDKLMDRFTLRVDQPTYVNIYFHYIHYYSLLFIIIYYLLYYINVSSSVCMVVYCIAESLC